ncbi:MAG: hypothetical protein QM655_12915 [Nocardioidaceae bacterium]
MNSDAQKDQRFLAAAVVVLGLIGGGVALVGGGGAWVLPALGLSLAAATLLVMPLAWDQVMGLRVDPIAFAEREGGHR